MWRKKKKDLNKQPVDFWKEKYVIFFLNGEESLQKGLVHG